MDENLSIEEDPKDWKWQEMARLVNSRYGLKYNDRQLKQLGRDNLTTTLIEEATNSVLAIDLSEGKAFLDPIWGMNSLADWVRVKFQIQLPASELAEKDNNSIKEIILQKVGEAYRQKEITFPVEVAMATHMAERTSTPGGAQKYDREGLFRWAQRRPQHTQDLSEQDFRTESRSKLKEMLLAVSKLAYPTINQEAMTTNSKKSFRAHVLPRPPTPRKSRTGCARRTRLK